MAYCKNKVIRANERYTNSKGKSRLVVSTEYNIMTKRTRVIYVNRSLNEASKSCYIEQFVKWLEI